MRDTAAGDISDLIPINSIRNDLRLIRDKLVDESFPINIDRDNINNIFTFCHVKAGEKSDRLMIELTIPTVENKIFTLFKIIPVPFKLHNALHMLNVEAKEIAIDSEMLQFVEIKNEDKCFDGENVEKICKSYAPIHLNNMNNCAAALILSDNSGISENYESKIIPYANYVIQLGNSNRYYIFITNTITARKICSTTTPVTFQLTEPAIIEIEPRCTISLLNLKLKSHATSIWKNEKDFSTTLNLNKLKFENNTFIGNNISNTETFVLDSPSDFGEILNQLDNLKVKTEMKNQIEKIDEKSEKIGYGLIVTIVIGLVISIIAGYMFINTIIPAAARIASMANRIPVI